MSSLGAAATEAPPDAEEMATRLQSAFFDGGGPVVSSCRRTAMLHLPEGGWGLRYALAISGGPRGASVPWYVNARVIPDRDALEDAHGELRRLASRVRGRPDLDAFARLVAVFRNLRMVASVFPLDIGLPTLVEATEPRLAAGLIGAALERRGESVAIEGCRVRVGRYGRRNRCVLRYEADLRSGSTLTVYGKVTGDGRGGDAHAVIEELRARGMDGPPLEVPRSLGFHPRLRLLLLEEAPGTTLAHAIRGAASATGPSVERDRELRRGIAMAAHVAARLHGSGIPHGSVRTPETEVDGLRDQVAWVAARSAGAGAVLHRRLEAAAARLADSESLPLGLCHGDYRHSQLLFEDQACTLIDFDTLCQGEPPLDLGRFLADLRLAAAKAGGPQAVDRVGALRDLFLSSYAEAAGMGYRDGLLLRSRTAAYETLGLVRLGVHSEQKMKRPRMALVLQLLKADR